MLETRNHLGYKVFCLSAFAHHAHEAIVDTQSLEGFGNIDGSQAINVRELWASPIKASTPPNGPTCHFYYLWNSTQSRNPQKGPAAKPYISSSSGSSSFPTMPAKGSSPSPSFCEVPSAAAKGAASSFFEAVFQALCRLCLRFLDELLHLSTCRPFLQVVILEIAQEIGVLRRADHLSLVA